MNFFFNHPFFSLIVTCTCSILLAMALLAGSHHAYFIPAELTGIGILVGAIGYVYTSTKDRLATDEASVNAALSELMNTTKDPADMKIILSIEHRISNSFLRPIKSPEILDDETRQNLVCIISKQYKVACSIVNRHYINIGRKITLSNDSDSDTKQWELLKKPENRFSIFLSFISNGQQLSCKKKYSNHYNVIYARYIEWTTLKQEHIFLELTEEEASQLYQAGLPKKWHINHEVTVEENWELIKKLTNILKLNDHGWQAGFNYITAMYKYSRLAESHLLSSTRYGDRDIAFKTEASGSLTKISAEKEAKERYEAEQNNVKLAISYFYGFLSLVDCVIYALGLYLPKRNQQELQRKLCNGLVVAESLCFYFMEECALPILFLNLSSIYRMSSQELSTWREEGIKFLILQTNTEVPLSTIKVEAQKILTKLSINYAYIEINRVGISQFWYFDPVSPPRRLDKDHDIVRQKLVDTSRVTRSQCSFATSPNFKASNIFRLPKESLEYIYEKTDHIPIVRCSSRKPFIDEEASRVGQIGSTLAIIPLTQAPIMPPPTSVLLAIPTADIRVTTQPLDVARQLRCSGFTAPPFPPPAGHLLSSSPIRPIPGWPFYVTEDRNGLTHIRDRCFNVEIYPPDVQPDLARQHLFARRSKSR